MPSSRSDWMECAKELLQGLETVTFECFHCCHGEADFSLARAVAVMKLLPSHVNASGFFAGLERDVNRLIIEPFEHMLVMSTKQITSVLFVERFQCKLNALLDVMCRLF